jgi:1,2-phenylacetyl-CoA epoxidase PaaB subunit
MDVVPLVHPWIDQTRAPIYVLTFPSQASDGELLGMCAARERWAQRAMYRVAWVVDLSGVLSATAQQRNLFSEHLKRFEAHDRAYNAGSALIVPNAFVRGLVTAVFWLRPPSFPNQCFPEAAQAFAWAEKQLAAADR